ncbi:uncharacterized [Tachysurus ichikawai]
MVSPDNTASIRPIRHILTPSSSDLLLLRAVLFLRCGRVDPHQSRTHTSPSIRKMGVCRETRCSREDQLKFLSDIDGDIEDSAARYG